MDTHRILDWIASSELGAVENEWLEAMGTEVDLADAKCVLEALKPADEGDLANQLVELLLETIQERDGQVAAMEAAVELLPSVPGNEALRELATDLYTHIHGQADYFEDFLRLSGLQAKQALSRAIQTLEISLTALKGTYLAERYGSRVARVEGYDDLLCQFVLRVGSSEELMDPILMADYFERVDETDFRVLAAFKPAELTELIQSDPAVMLVSLCKSNEGSIDTNKLRDRLTGKYIEAKAWSRWWSRARTAARKSDVLSVEGRNPAVISYHPHGRSLEQEMAPAVERARVPLEYLAVLQQYASDVAFRKLEIDAEFAGSIVEALAEQADTFRNRRPDEAMEAALALDAAAEMGMPAAQREHPSAADILAAADCPVDALAKLEEASLWPLAIRAMATRPDAADQLIRLLPNAPVGQMDDIAHMLRQAERPEALDEAITAAMTRPTDNALLLLWLWQDPVEPMQAADDKLALLARLLTVTDEFARSEDVATREFRRTVLRQIRSSLVAKDCQSFRKAVKQMDVDIAQTIKRRIERSDGLTDASREDLIRIMRDEFYALFAEKRIDPWLDEATIWTTETALEEHKAKFKKLMEVDMPANSRAIGAAAEHGDLSENSEWKFAIEEQHRLRARAKHMQDELLIARVIDPYRISRETVGIGAKLVLRSQDSSSKEVTFLGPWEGDPRKSIYNYQTPLAQECMGKKIGDTVQMRLDGQEKEYTIVQIGSAFDKEDDQ